MTRSRRYPAPVAAVVATAALLPTAAFADSADVLFSDTFYFSPFTGTGAPNPRWVIADESGPNTAWQVGPGSDGDPGYAAIDSGYIETIVPLQVDPNAYYRIAYDARSDFAGTQAGVNFRWNNPLTTAWQTFEAVTPGYASAFADAQGNASIRVVGRNSAGVEVDNIRLEQITTIEAAQWGADVRASLPAQVTTTQHVSAENTIGATLEKLRAGETVRVVMLGDSVVNDTAHSTWAAQVSSLFAGNIEVIPSIRNGTGMQYYQGNVGSIEELEQGFGPLGTPRIQGRVLDYDPDLVILGGVSHGFDASAYANVINQIQAGSDADILVTSEIGGYDYGSGSYLLDDWAYELDAQGERFEDELLALALDEGVGFADLRGSWGQFLRDSEDAGASATNYYRDPVHLNHLGQEVVGAALASFFLEGQDPTDFPSVVATNPLDAYGLDEFVTLSAYFGLATDLGDARGDFNTDGVVNLLDFDLLAANFESAPADVVPEPATAGLIALTGLAAAARRRRA